MLWLWCSTSWAIQDFYLVRRLWCINIRGNTIALLTVKAIWLQCFFFFFPKGTSYGKVCRMNFKGSSFDCKLEFLVPFLRVKMIAAQTAPPPRPRFPQKIQLTFWENHFIENSRSGVKMVSTGPIAAALFLDRQSRRSLTAIPSRRCVINFAEDGGFFLRNIEYLFTDANIFLQDAGFYYVIEMFLLWMSWLLLMSPSWTSLKWGC